MIQAVIPIRELIVWVLVYNFKNKNMRKNKILSVIGGLAAFIFTSCDGIFDVDYYTFCPKIIYLPMNLLLRRGYWDVTNCFIRIVSEEVRGGYVLI